MAGFHCKSREEFKFSNIKIWFNELEDWMRLDTSDFKLDSKKKKININYKQKSKKTIRINNKFKTLLNQGLSVNYLSDKYPSIGIIQDSYIEFQSTSSFSLDDVFNNMEVIRNYISFMTTYIVVPIKILITPSETLLLLLIGEA